LLASLRLPAVAAFPFPALADAMPSAHLRRITRARRSPLAAVALFMVAALMVAPMRENFAMPKGKAVAPGHGARTNLKKHPLEIPLEAPEPEPEPAAERLEYRPPFTFHLLTQFPQHKRMKEDTQSMKYIRSKLLHALEHSQDHIQHVEATVKYEEHFHRHVNRKHVSVKSQREEDSQVAESPSEFKLLAPYQVKVVVNLKNKKQVIFANPEKHAQTSLNEAVDLASETLKVMLHKQKEIFIDQYRKARDAVDLDEVGQELQSDVLAVEQEENQEEDDAAMEELYQRVEAGDPEKREPASKQVVRDGPVYKQAVEAKPAAAKVTAATKTKAPAAKKAEAPQVAKSAGSLKSLLLD